MAKNQQNPGQNPQDQRNIQGQQAQQNLQSQQQRGAQGQKEQQKGGRRVSVDCRRSPQSQGCTLEVSGNEQEVLDVLVPHVVRRHNMQDTPDTREQIRSMFQETH